MARPGLPICLVTGFLGAGKTTLLNHVLKNRSGLRAVVFVNEFGSVDVDGTLVKWQGMVSEDRIITLDNGCMCCEVNEDLVRQLQRVLRKHASDLDFIIIETSGVCDPGPILQTLEMSKDLAFCTHLDSVLAVVDASDFNKDALQLNAAQVTGLQGTAQSQVMHSDVVLFNKCDLLGGVDSESALQAEAAFGRCLTNGAACILKAAPRIIRTEHALVDLALITSVPEHEVVPHISTHQTQKPETKEDNESCSLRSRSKSRSRSPPSQMCEDGKRSNAAICRPFSPHASAVLRSSVGSFVYKVDRPFDPLKFEEWLEAGGPPRSIVRAKGLVWLYGIPRPVVFQLSGSRTNPFETSGDGGPPSSSTLVFIGQASALRDGDKKAVCSALDACLC